MTYGIEDEVDWSDGTIDDPPPASTSSLPDSGYMAHTVHEHDSLDYLLEPQKDDDYQLPPDGILPSATAQPAVTRAQCTRIGEHLNRRQPSKQDYAHFALYQANQKAYEATFFKHFVTHALHPSQIEKCFNNGTDSFLNLQRYVASVCVNVNAVANKMIWNAHCRAVNLLANDDTDGVPFWDINSFDRHVFVDFEPENLVSVAPKLNESWHRTVPEPYMVRYTARDYPIGSHSSPFDDIDEVADTLFEDAAFDTCLPPDRIVRRSTTRKGKGRGLPGASIREPLTFVSRDSWLASLVPSTPAPAWSQSPLEQTAASSTVPDNSSTAELELPSGLRLQDEVPIGEPLEPTTTVEATVEAFVEPPRPGLTRLERLFDVFGADALSDRLYFEHFAPNREHIDQVPPWPMRLFQYHKQRLKQRSPQVFRRALPGIRAVIADAISRGYQLVDPNFEELIIDIEAREQAETTALPITEEVPYPQDISQEVSGPTQGESDLPQKVHNGKKRRRQQPPPIRMFNKPIEPKKKRRKLDAGTAVVDPPTDFSVTAQILHKQKITARPPNSTSKSTAQKPSLPALSSSALSTSLPPHPSGSATLEPHQHLPPTAYFTPQVGAESLAWRCGIKHALGHYYNAGNRKNCPGCFTALSDNPRAVTMDFHLPSRTHYHQPNPTTRWRPSKPFARLGRARRSKTLSHNSIAKEAYWAAQVGGANDAEAMKVAIETVLEKITPKLRKEPTPPPEPEPEPDLGPHPSGSATMEHGQDLPSCASFAPLARSVLSEDESEDNSENEEQDKAWRCDVNHALGRYYMAGDRRSCPGCGSNKNGTGKSAIMDFWLPRGIVVRQEVDIVRWKPRKPYKLREKISSANEVKRDVEPTETAKLEGGVKARAAYAKKRTSATPCRSTSTSSCSNPLTSTNKIRSAATPQTHNQLASRKYFSALNSGLDPTAALEQAIRETEVWADGERNNNSRPSALGTNDEHPDVKTRKKMKEKKAGKGGAHSEFIRKPGGMKSGKAMARRGRGGREDDTPTASLALNALRARTAQINADGEQYEGEQDEIDGHYQTDHDEVMHDARLDAQEEDETSSDEEEESSGSDSE